MADSGLPGVLLDDTVDDDADTGPAPAAAAAKPATAAAASQVAAPWTVGKREIKAALKGRGPERKVHAKLGELSEQDIATAARVLDAMCYAKGGADMAAAANAAAAQKASFKGKPNADTLTDAKKAGGGGAAAPAPAAGAGAGAVSGEPQADVATDRRFKDIRKYVFELSQKLERTQFGGMDKEQYTAFIIRKQQKREKDAQKARLKDLDRRHINSGALRSSRLQALAQLTLPDEHSQNFISNTLQAIEGPTAGGVKLLTAPDSAPANAEAGSQLAAAAAAAAAGPEPARPTAILPGRLTAPPGSNGPSASSTNSTLGGTNANSFSASIGNAEHREGKKKETKKEKKERHARQKEERQAEFAAEVQRLNGDAPAAVPAAVAAKADAAAPKPAAKPAAAAAAAPKQKPGAAAAATVSSEAPANPNPHAAAGSAAAAGGATGTAGAADGPASGAAGCGTERPRELSYARSCYVCKKRFVKLHHFYDQLCPECADLNWAKRNQVVDLKGRVILLTGSRVKIGFEAGVRLLRCGATLIATSRFPHDTASRYAKQPDFDTWKERLHIFGLDLRDLRSVVKFCDILCQRYSRLDAIVNNAAQTVRRPPAYYRHLMPTELAPVSTLPKEQRDLVKGDPHRDFFASVGKAAVRGIAGPNAGAAADTATGTAAAKGTDTKTAASSVVIQEVHADDDLHTGTATGTGAHTAAKPAAAAATAPAAVAAGAGAGKAGATVQDVTPGRAAAEADEKIEAEQRGAAVMSAVIDVIRGDGTGSAAGTTSVTGTDQNTVQNVAAAMSQVALMAGDRVFDTRLFPAGAFDVTGQQLDLRRVNSWLLLLDQVDPSELVEVFAINALAPFILNSRLKRLLCHPYAPHKWVVNVSAMEGKFYRFKGPQHPHTNMAKAALNMMTRTSAQDYARDNIFMTSVDTGWINDENPFEKSQHNLRANFQTPIDEIDAAARIIDPILSGVSTGQSVSGLFLKDYHETEW